jgi:hypothetical protein
VPFIAKHHRTLTVIVVAFVVVGRDRIGQILSQAESNVVASINDSNHYLVFSPTATRSL